MVGMISGRLDTNGNFGVGATSYWVEGMSVFFADSISLSLSKLIPVRTLTKRWVMGLCGHQKDPEIRTRHF
jgi:hypothetical protein